jgi:4a-hydroxytetrahydrobiopterin dehydratase
MAQEQVMGYRGKMDTISEEEARGRLEGLPGWEYANGRIRKQFVFRTFLRAIAFVNAVAYMAEAANHHPDMTINYNKVTLRLITYSEGALTERDFDLARRIEQLPMVGLAEDNGDTAG